MRISDRAPAPAGRPRAPRVPSRVPRLPRASDSPGALPSDALVGRRTQALLAAGVLVLSTAAPAAPSRQSPTRSRRAAAAPDQAAADEHESELPVDAPDPDPGWQEEPDALAPDTELPADQPPVQDTNDGEEPTVDVPSGADPEQRRGAGGRCAARRGPERRGAAGATMSRRHRTPEPPAPVAPPAPEGAASPPAPPVGAAAAKPPIGTASSGPPLKSFVERPARERHARIAQTTAPAPAEIPTAAPEPSAPADGARHCEEHAGEGQAERSPATASTSSRPGESLWSIASDLLGDDASVARIAREVNRLWELNGDHIGTGDPDLLMVGTKLALR